MADGELPPGADAGHAVAPGEGPADQGGGLPDDGGEAQDGDHEDHGATDAGQDGPADAQQHDGPGGGEELQDAQHEQVVADGELPPGAVAGHAVAHGEGPADQGGGLPDEGGDAHEDAEEQEPGGGEQGVDPKRRWPYPGTAQQGVVEITTAPITRVEIEKALSHTRNSAPGEDGIDAAMLKALATPSIDCTDAERQRRSAVSTRVMDRMASDLSAIMSSGEWKESWKRGRTILLPKTPMASTPSRFRAITLLPSMGRLMEKTLLRRLHIQGGRRTTPFQAGFIPGLGALFQAASLQNALATEAAEGRNVTVAFLDLSTAFDTVSHDAIDKGLERLDIGPDTRLLIASMLRGRTTRIRSGDEWSKPVTCARGTPQGGILSPYLFNAAVDFVIAKVSSMGDIKWKDKNGIRHALGALGFADDVALLANDENLLTEMINTATSEMEKLGLMVNTTKCEFLRRGQFPVGTRGGDPIRMGGTAMRQVDTARYLGAYIDARYTGGRNNMTKNADRRSIDKRRMRLRKAAATWRMTAACKRRPVGTARAAFICGFRASGMFGIELDGNGQQGRGAFNELSATYNGALRRAVGMHTGDSTGSTANVFMTAGVVPLADEIAKRTIRLAKALLTSPCPLQQALHRRAATANPPAEGSVQAAADAWLGAYDNDGGAVAEIHEILDQGAYDVAMMNQGAEPATVRSGYKERLTKSLLKLETARRKEHHTIKYVERHGAGTAKRDFVVSSEVPAHTLATTARKAIVRLRNGHYAGRAGPDNVHRSVEETNEANRCSFCDVGTQSPEHVMMHCVHTKVQTEWQLSWTSETIETLLTTFHTGTSKQKEDKRGKRLREYGRWMVRIETMMYAAHFKGEKHQAATHQEQQAVRAHVRVLLDEHEHRRDEPDPEEAAKRTRLRRWLDLHKEIENETDEEAQQREEDKRNFKVPAPLLKKVIGEDEEQ